jgi:predicted nucleotidyltransferase
MQKARTRKIVEKYARRLKEKNIPLSRIYLFGSFSRGDERKDSDIDVAVVLRKKETDDLVGEVGVATIGIDTRIEPHIFSEKDFKTRATPLIEEVIETGIKVA